MLHVNRNGLVALLAAVCALTCTASRGQEQAQEPLSPASTTVAVLPVANVTGLTDRPEIAGINRAVAEEIHRQFEGRGFKIIAGKPVDDAVARLKVDLNDLEQQKRAVIRSVGKDLGANLVAFVSVTDVTTNSVGGFAFSGSTTYVKVKCWLLEAGSDRSLMSGRIEAVGHDTVQLGPAHQESAAARACVAAVRHAFERVLKPYPILKGNHLGN